MVCAPGGDCLNSPVIHCYPQLFHIAVSRTQRLGLREFAGQRVSAQRYVVTQNYDLNR
jgi:hypothetical protein